MLTYRVLFVVSVLLAAPAAASAQLRFQPRQQFSRLDTRPLPLSQSRYRIAIADSARRQSYWQNGWWTGFGLGAFLGTMIAVGNHEGYPHTFREKVWGSLMAGTAIGVPLGVIGGLIGDSFKKPVQSMASP